MYGNRMAKPYIITIASEKGGVGKTTLATNLSVYLKALAEDIPVTLFSFDNHFTVDQMFQLGKKTPVKHVGQLFTGTSVEELITIGQYGVNYIRSNHHSFEYLKHIKNVDTLARVLGDSQSGGIIIIDTSPVLDKYTCNAIHAADRVIVPIKDAPSLENCRHLAEFAVDNGRSKSLLKILPCLIDTRIHFDGPFRNSYQLLKAYAINRGYRCYDGFISKSPKVETLGTNPSGKIYPVMTHARQTDVHLQLTHLARQVYLDYLEQGPMRLKELAGELFRHDELRRKEFNKRRSAIQPTCLCCSAEIDRNNIWANAYFLENSDGSFRGFIESECFFQLLLKDCYPELAGKDQQALLRDLLNSPSHGDYLLFHQKHDSPDKVDVKIQRLDQQGNKLAERNIELKKRGLLNMSSGQLIELLARALPDSRESQTLLARRMGDNPLEILRQEGYQSWQATFNRALINLHQETSAAESINVDNL